MNEHAPFSSQKALKSTKKGASQNKIIVKNKSILHKSYKMLKNHIFCIVSLHTDNF